ncbi:MAG: hypothetical protein JST05_09520 [Acidobacteria bacterium]|nr:hypothetical protein [Acidobacteriota bacterium]
MAYFDDEPPNRPGVWVPIQTRTFQNPRSGKVRSTPDGWPITVWIRVL